MKYTKSVQERKFPKHVSFQKQITQCQNRKERKKKKK